MFKEKEIKMPVVSTNTTSGLVSVLQLADTTPSEMFATVRNDTSDLEIQHITYSPIELPKEFPIFQKSLKGVKKRGGDWRKLKGSLKGIVSTKDLEGEHKWELKHERKKFGL